MRDRFIDMLLSVSEEDGVVAGQILFTIGETNVDQGCLILEGAVKVTLADHVVKYMEAPDLLGEVQLFMPQAKRTATVEVVFGGPILRFKWHDLGSLAKHEFSGDELEEFRDIVKHSATLREKNMLDSLDPRKRE